MIEQIIGMLTEAFGELRRQQRFYRAEKMLSRAFDLMPDGSDEQVALAQAILTYHHQLALLQATKPKEEKK